MLFTEGTNDSSYIRSSSLSHSKMNKSFKQKQKNKSPERCMLNNYLSSIENLNLENSKLKETFFEMANDLKQKALTIEESNKIIKKLENEFSKILAEYMQTENLNTQLNNKLNNLNKELDKIKRDNEKLIKQNKKIDDLENEIMSLKNENSNLKSKITNLNSTKLKKDLDIKLSEGVLQNLHDKSEKYALLVKEKEALINELNIKIKNGNNIIEQKTNENNELKILLKSLKKTNKDNKGGINELLKQAIEDIKIFYNKNNIYINSNNKSLEDNNNNNGLYKFNNGLRMINFSANNENMVQYNKEDKFTFKNFENLIKPKQVQILLENSLKDLFIPNDIESINKEFLYILNLKSELIKTELFSSLIRENSFINFTKESLFNLSNYCSNKNYLKEFINKVIKLKFQNDELIKDNEKLKKYNNNFIKKKKELEDNLNIIHKVMKEKFERIKIVFDKRLKDIKKNKFNIAKLRIRSEENNNFSILGIGFETINDKDRFDIPNIISGNSHNVRVNINNDINYNNNKINRNCNDNDNNNNNNNNKKIFKKLNRNVLVNTRSTSRINKNNRIITTNINNNLNSISTRSLLSNNKTCNNPNLSCFNKNNNSFRQNYYEFSGFDKNMIVDSNNSNNCKTICKFINKCNITSRNDNLIPKFYTDKNYTKKKKLNLKKSFNKIFPGQLDNYSDYLDINKIDYNLKDKNNSSNNININNDSKFNADNSNYYFNENNKTDIINRSYILNNKKISQNQGNSLYDIDNYKKKYNEILTKYNELLAKLELNKINYDNLYNINNIYKSKFKKIKEIFNPMIIIKMFYKITSKIFNENDLKIYNQIYTKSDTKNILRIFEEKCCFIKNKIYETNFENDLNKNKIVVNKATENKNETMGNYRKNIIVNTLSNINNNTKEINNKFLYNKISFLKKLEFDTNNMTEIIKNYLITQELIINNLLENDNNDNDYNNKNDKIIEFEFDNIEKLFKILEDYLKFKVNDTVNSDEFYRKFFNKCFKAHKNCLGISLEINNILNDNNILL